MEVRSFQLPRWLAPLTGLLALVLIPVAVMVAFLFAALALGTTVIRAFIPAISSQKFKSSPVINSKDSSVLSQSSAIDVEYEVKDQK
jgi:hypothetical protein